MDHPLSNKIEATDTSIKSLLKGKKFYIDYFQREYRWEKSHMVLLVEDLTTTFLRSYRPEHERKDVQNYQNYYIGPVVFSKSDGKQSIIDGQQRITSITLLLIYLNHLQQTSNSKVIIDDLIYSEQYGEKSFNMTDESRKDCLSGLYEKGFYDAQPTDDETILNMITRYDDIGANWPEEIDAKALPYFIDWLIELVVIVEITAYSDENAYTIFETMNDRGLNLTPTEMLKGYVLSRINNKAARIRVNDIWKEAVQKLHTLSDTADQRFFQAWFRAKYAMAFRQSRSGSADQDFELIGTRFHNWFKENHAERLQLNTSEEFIRFFSNDFPFFVKTYIQIIQGKKSFNSEYPHLCYLKQQGIAESLEDPLLLAPLLLSDSLDEINRKIDFVSRYIETFTVRRASNYRKYGQSTIKYTMFNVIKKIRNKGVSSLGKNLAKAVTEIEENWSTFGEFRMHQQNKKFVKHLLSRFSHHLDNEMGKDTNYLSYQNPNGRQFEIEHIWNNQYADYQDEFEQENEFQVFRNMIGGLILLPNGTNQSYGKKPYSQKVEHYVKENALAQTLNKKFYELNPNFLRSLLQTAVRFRAHDAFRKEDLLERQKVYQRLAERIWSTDYFLN